MTKYHTFQPKYCDWCDTEIPIADASLPNDETHGHIETFERQPRLEFFNFFNDIGTRGARRNLCLNCFNKLCAFEDEQPKMKQLNQCIEELHHKAMLTPNHLVTCPYCKVHEEDYKAYIHSL
jgi:hypothetical protein